MLGPAPRRGARAESERAAFPSRGCALLLALAFALPTGMHATDQAELLARAQAAVSGLRATALSGARSNASLGRERSGSGVVPDAEGLVLTIGYLVLEADEVALLLPGGCSLPARIVAADPASGFGLVQALAALRIAPAPLGRSAGVAADEPPDDRQRRRAARPQAALGRPDEVAAPAPGRVSAASPSTTVG